MKKVRKLNNYFTTTNRIARLEEVQKFFQYPVLKTKVDVEVRVASTITVFQRTIVNFKAFEKYFERCDSDDDPSIFNALSADDWKLMVELEAVMNNISRLALVEIQREHLLASENIVLMKLAIDKLNASSFACMDIDAPRTPKTNAANFPRVARKTEAFLQETTTGIARTIGQMKKRFPKLTTEIVMPLLLDPRTAPSAKFLAVAIGKIHSRLVNMKTRKKRRRKSVRLRSRFRLLLRQQNHFCKRNTDKSTKCCTLMRLTTMMTRQRVLTQKKLTVLTWKKMI